MSGSYNQGPRRGRGRGANQRTSRGGVPTKQYGQYHEVFVILLNAIDCI